MRGPYQLLNEEEIEDLKLNMTVLLGKPITEEEIKEKIQQTHEKRLWEQGKISLVPCEPFDWTLCKFYATVACQPGVSLYTSAIYKTNILFTTENSIIFTLACVCVL